MYADYEEPHIIFTEKNNDVTSKLNQLDTKQEIVEMVKQQKVVYRISGYMGIPNRAVLL